jgi:D-alanyl-D-alanine carboxypeptidase (penicillin-binding protein 5/6)
MRFRAEVTRLSFGRMLVVPAAAALGSMALLIAAFAPSDTEAISPVTIPPCALGTTDTLAASLPGRLESASPPPPISASAAAVIDGETGRVLYELNAHERRAPASTTKIMTGILAVEIGGDPNRRLRSETDASRMVGSSVMGLRPGTEMSMRDMLYGLMLPSGNDAAIELARNIDGNVRRFVDRMNAKAEALGLRDTHFANPHGLDSRSHYSSAYDLAMLGRYAMANEQFAAIASATEWHLAPPSDYDLYNGNSLLDRYPGANGVKIGWTEDAGWTFVASAERDGRRLFVTVLASTDRDADAAALFDWAYASHEWISVSPRAAVALRMAGKLGAGRSLFQQFVVCA